MVNQNEMIGAQIRSARIARQLTLKQMSEASGLSVGFLSQLERGISSIAVDALAQLANILGVTISSLLDGANAASPDPVVHGFALRSCLVGPGTIQYMLSHDMDGYTMLPRMFLLQPPSEESQGPAEMQSHPGDEFVYVLEGVATVFLEGRQHTLYPGDSIQIPANAQHSWANRTNKTVRVLSVNSLVTSMPPAET